MMREISSGNLFHGATGMVLGAYKVYIYIYVRKLWESGVYKEEIIS